MVHDPEIYIARRPDQQKALTSPTRLEIVGHCICPEGMSIAEVAQRMGRTPTSLYYHFGLLEKVGLLKRVGSRRRGRRNEALYGPVAPRIPVPGANTSKQGNKNALKTAAAAFRMAERDMEEALRSGSPRTGGPFRNFLAMRMHLRLTRKSLSQINTHLRAIDRIAGQELRRRRPPPNANQYCSLTIALLPLRGRSSE